MVIAKEGYTFPLPIGKEIQGKVAIHMGQYPHLGLPHPLMITILLFVSSVLHAPAYGQQALSEAEQKYQQAFDAMQTDLENPERSFEFMQAAVAVGDFPGAIAALERILLLNPGLANIQLELGVLYLRVGSPALAATYLRQALSSPEVPQTVRARAVTLLAQAERSLKLHVFSGRIYLAGRYDSNANAAPGARQVRVRGQEGLLEEGDTGRADFSGELVLSLQYVYALPSHAGHEIEANFVTYNRRYDKSPEVNVDTLSLDAGPRFFLASPRDPELSIRPFISASYLFLEDASYLRALGGGLHIRKIFSFAWVGEATFEAQDQTFFNTEKRPTSSNRSGLFLSLASRLNYQVTTVTLVSAGLNGARRDARADFESFYEGGLTLSLTQAYRAPFRLTASSWSAALSFSIRRTIYDEADPLVDPNEKRRDTRFEVIVSNNIPLTQPLTLVLSTLYTKNDSSLPNFKYDAIGGSIGVAWSF